MLALSEYKEFLFHADSQGYCGLDVCGGSHRIPLSDYERILHAFTEHDAQDEKTKLEFTDIYGITTTIRLCDVECVTYISPEFAKLRVDNSRLEMLKDV